MKRLVVLDSSVIGGIAAAPTHEQDAAFARLAVAKKKGAQILVTPTIVGEIAATHARSETFEKLLKTILQACDGWLDLQAPEILRLELDEDDPYALITGRKAAALGELEALKEIVEDEEVKKFYEEGGYGYEGLRHLLEALDPVKKKVRDQIESFPEYAEARRRACLEGLLAVAQEKGHIAKKDWDAEALWQRGTAWRFSTLVLLANEYRRLTQTQKKGEGSLTDMRIVIEVAYSHELKTRDKELAGCGGLANKIMSKPAISSW